MSGGVQAPRALVVDDAPEFRRLVAAALSADGFAVREAGDGEGALTECREQPPDVVVLDLGLPGIDGLETCRRLRGFCDAYVIMLTSRADEVDTLVGLAAGADDYVVKPSTGRQIAARARAMLRRPRGETATHERDVRRVGALELDADARQVTIDGAPVELTRIEFDILDVLTRNPKVVVQRGALLEAVWGDGWFPDDHVIDVHISNVRRKLGRSWVTTVRGVGYRLGDGG